MQIDEFVALIQKRRSIRKFKTNPVPNDAYDMAKFMSNDAVQEFIRSHRERNVKHGTD